MKWIIGLRNVKTGIAICICIIVAALLRLEYPFYAAIATIISMENSVTNSFTAGKQRMMGTLVGAVVGASFAFVEPGNAYYCAIGVMVVIYICNLLNWNKSVSIGCIVFLAIMLNLKNGENPMSYGFHRITDTLIGIVIAVIVNYLVFPPKHEISLHKARKALARRMSQMFEQMTAQGEAPNLKSLRSQLGSLEKYYQLCKYEFHLKKDLTETMEQIGEEIDSYRHIYEHLIILRRLMEEHHLRLVPCGRLAAGVAGPGGSGQAVVPGGETEDNNRNGGLGDKLADVDVVESAVRRIHGIQEVETPVGGTIHSVKGSDVTGNGAIHVIGEADVLGDAANDGQSGVRQTSKAVGESGEAGQSNRGLIDRVSEQEGLRLDSAENDGSHSAPDEARVAYYAQDFSPNDIGIVYDYHVKWVFHEMQKLGLPVPHPNRILVVGGAE